MPGTFIHIPGILIHIAPESLFTCPGIRRFGIICGFLMVGIGEYRHESTAASRFSIILMFVTVLLWIVFFMADDRARKRINGPENAMVVVDLLTMTGTFLAVFTLLGIGFFVVIAPRVP